MSIPNGPPCAFSPATRDTSHGYNRQCGLSPWEESEENYCILHAEVSDKPHDKINEAIAEHDQPIPNVQLFDIEDGSDLDFEGAKLPGANFSGSTLEDVCFSGALLRDADFSETDLTRADFSGDANLREACFDGASCNQTKFSQSRIPQTTFHDATLTSTRMNYARGSGAEFHDATIVDTVFFQSNLDNCGFINATLRDCTFRAADLDGTKFSDSDITATDFLEAQLTDTRFSGATLDENTDLGTKLMSEYQADRLAEPDWVIRGVGVITTDDTMFGVESSRPLNSENARSHDDEPPDSPIESQMSGVFWWIYIRLLAPIRFVYRLKARLNQWARGSSEQIEHLQSAQGTYSEIKTAYRASPGSESARYHNIREKECRRKQLKLLFPWVRYAAIKRLMKYGESPRQVIKFGLVVWAISTALFLHFGIATESGSVIYLDLSGEVNWGRAIRVSLFSMRRLFTFSNGNMALAPEAETVGVVTSATGAIIEAALVFTLGRRAVS
ncbi:pentapeptide repeat-containing protein [Halorhabdus salina]|uniref:pentapeptide repeat-containing protein n=1 Tax=Halorhabdus salina TaxID=2750670 RepID=UPI0015EE3E65|nr:pentapeptide repeat-containing protein [Halorhabdus salina]